MALNKTTLVPVTNISGGFAGYVLEELHVNRTFAPGETKQIPAGEIRALAFTHGGETLIREVLSIRNAELLEELGVQAEKEYFWTKTDVENLLASGSLEELQDALDFAPSGIIELIQQTAIETELNDMSKREAIKVATGYDVTKILALTKSDDEDEADKAPAKPVRRVNASSPATPTRRVTAAKAE